MKICFITDTFCDVNGVSRFLQDMLEISSNREDEVFLLTVTNKKMCKEYENSIVLKPRFSFPIPYYKELDIVIPSFRAIKKELDTIAPDIVHISTPGVIGLYGRYYAKKHGLKIAGTYHTDFPSYVYKNTKIKLFEKIIEKYMYYFYKDFALLFTRSCEYIKPLIHNINLKQEQIKILQAGTDTKKFTPFYKNDDFKIKYNIENNKKVFLYVGRITSEKNIEFILDIFINDLKNEKAILLLAGAGDENIIDKKVSKNIVFLGTKRAQELYELYANADCFVFPSTTDTLGQVVLESLSSGTPALVSDIGGPKFIIENSKSEVGFVLEHDKKEKWIEKIQSICENKIDLVQLSNNARTYAMSFDIQNSYDDFIYHHKNI